MRVEKPRAEHAGVASEHFFEFFIQYIDKHLLFRLGIAYGKATVRVLIPGEPTTPGKTAVLHLWLDDLVPYPQFKLRGVKGEEDFGKFGADQGVVL